MPDYQKLYTLLFNAFTDALEDLQKMNFGSARERLFQAQVQAEELYISSGPGQEEPLAEGEGPDEDEIPAAACAESA